MISLFLFGPAPSLPSFALFLAPLVAKIVIYEPRLRQLISEKLLRAARTSQSTLVMSGAGYVGASFMLKFASLARSNVYAADDSFSKRRINERSFKLRVCMGEKDDP